MPRQLKPVVIAPPRIGPTAVAMPVTAPQTPNAMPRSRPVKVAARIASDVANSMAPPTPWAAREPISISGLTAAPRSAEPAVNTTRPSPKTSRRPKRSESDPAVSSSAARESA